MRANVWTSLRKSLIGKTPLDFKILLNDSEFLALEKPYNYTITSNKSKFESLTTYIGDLEEKYGCKLYMTKNSEFTQNYSGIILFGKSQNMYQYLSEAYDKFKISEKYLAILTKKPDQDSGQINIPIRRYDVKFGQMNKCLPNSLGIYQHQEYFENDIKPAQTYFHVISIMPPPPKTYSNTYKNYSTRTRSCLCGFKTSTCFKEQIQVHSSQVLGCPILGDHKYSSPSPNQPQNLPKFMLKLLKLNDSWEIKTIPLFLHLSEISFQSPVRSNLQIIIRCPTPDYFQAALDFLSITY